MDPRWEALYAQTRPSLYRAAAGIAGEADAEGVVQDAFQRGMGVTAFFDEIKEPYAWLRRVAVRIAVSRLRRRAVWDRIRRLLVSESSRDPNVTWALQRLPPTQRAAIVLRYYFREDYATIAAVIGLSESSVATTLSRARAALRRDLM